MPARDGHRIVHLKPAQRPTRSLEGASNTSEVNYHEARNPDNNATIGAIRFEDRLSRQFASTM
jgi:hypothetical protein